MWWLCGWSHFVPVLCSMLNLVISKPHTYTGSLPPVPVVSVKRLGVCLKWLLYGKAENVNSWHQVLFCFTSFQIQDCLVLAPLVSLKCSSLWVVLMGKKILRHFQTLANMETDLIVQCRLWLIYSLWSSLVFLLCFSCIGRRFSSFFLFIWCL